MKSLWCCLFLVAVMVGCGYCTQREGIDLNTTDVIFALIGDSLTVFCNHSSINDDDLLQISIFRKGKRYHYISTTATATKPETTSSTSSASSSSSSSSIKKASSFSGVEVAGLMNVTEDFLGINTIVCETNENVTIQETTLYVQGPITDIGNVSSVWVFNRYTLHVNWTWGWLIVEDFVDVKVVWSVGAPPNLGGWACMDQQKTSCTVTGRRFQNTIYFLVSVNVKDVLSSKYIGQKQSDVINAKTASSIPGFKGVFNFSVDLSHAVKPGPPTGFRLVSSTSRCLHVTWENPEFFYAMEENASFSIVVRNLITNYIIIPEFSSSSDTLQQTNPPVLLCQLNPDTLYGLTLRVKPVGKGHWSESATLVARTEEDKPDRGPEITNTSYWSGPCMAGEREIIIYWKEIPRNQAHGDIDFLIKFNFLEFKVRSEANHVRVQLACNKTYLVDVYSATKAGLTDFPSTLIVPSEKEEMDTPDDLRFKVTKMESSANSTLLSVKVTWSCPEPSACSTQSIDIYYCVDESFSTNICIDEIQHRRVPLQNEVLMIDDISDRTDMFGFALSDGLYSVQGITWTNCVADANKIPSWPTGVTAYRGRADDSILVKWDTPYCGSAFVSSYRVSYCRSDFSSEADSCPAVTVNGSASTTQITGLDLDSSYTVTVVAQSSAGNSPRSLPFTLSLTHGSQSVGNLKIHLSIIFGILLLLVIAVVLGWFMRKFRKRMTLMKKDFGSLNVVISSSVSLEEDSGRSTLGPS